MHRSRDYFPCSVNWRQTTKGAILSWSQISVSTNMAWKHYLCGRYWELEWWLGESSGAGTDRTIVMLQEPALSAAVTSCQLEPLGGPPDNHSRVMFMLSGSSGNVQATKLVTDRGRGASWGDVLIGYRPPYFVISPRLVSTDMRACAAMGKHQTS